MGNTNQKITVRVASKRMVAEGIALFDLVSVAGEQLPPFTAGSHIDVQVPNGLVRQYSLCNDPRDSHHYSIAVQKEPNSRGGSTGMHDLLHEGHDLNISVPRNHFPLMRSAKKSLLLAGGIGITPLLSMAIELSNSEASFELHCCSRNRKRAAFVDQLQSKFGQQVKFHFDDGDEGQKLDLNSLLSNPSPEVHLYTCGPKGFMDAVLDTARSSGWNDQNLHYEFFSAPQTSFDTEDVFEVVVASSGRVIPVTKDQTILAALTGHGIDLPFSCEQGVCGTCLTNVLEGIPDHRDMYLTPEEQSANDKMLVCCSRAKSPRLVLEI